jgi:predicted ATPase
VFTTRPDRDAPGWRLVNQARDAFGDALVEINLAPLTEAESRTLVANLLEIESLPPRVRDFILARAEGNPFFVEEVVRMLIDRGAIERHGETWVATAQIEGVEIPDTLQGLLLARIDRLPDDARRTLRVASVIGRQFSARVLEEVLAEAGANS